MQTRSSSPAHVKVVEGFAPRHPDVPIYLMRDEVAAKQFYRKGYKQYRVTVTIEEITE